MSTPAGWYDDGSGRQRWWDGQQWTENFAPEGQTATDATTSNADIPAFAPDADVNATAAYPGAYQAPGTGDQYGTHQDGGAYQGPAEPTGPKKTPVLGFVGFGLAVVGTILACIPVTFVFGAVLLFAAFVVSLIAIFQKNTKKWPSITGLVLSIVGGIVGTIIFVFAVIFAVGDAVSSLPSSAPTSGSVEPDETDSDEPVDAAGEGRPSADEVAAGFREIVATMGMTDELTDEQISCYADYFVASDIPDETLWVIASGDETLSDVDAATEFTEKLTDGMSTCLIP